MGMAARVGDPTAHGGAIMPPGCVTVLIGGMPAARLTDMQSCPLVTPVGPAAVPHAVGPILGPGSPTVLIGKMPAAVQGDSALCVPPAPPSTIAMGCPTVMIGMSGGGGGGGGGAGAGMAGSGSATKGAITSATLANIQPDTVDIDNHFLHVTFQDKGKLPITGYRYTLKGPDGVTYDGTLSGEIKRRGIAEGDYEITLFGIVNTQWSTQDAKVGDTVKMKVKTIGIENGTKATLEIFVKDANYTDYRLKTIESQVNGDKIEEDYTLEVDDKLLGICGQKEQNNRYSQPYFYYKVNIGDLTEQSALLLYKDHVEIKVKDEEGNTIADKKYKAHLPTGEVKEGMLDSSGKAKIDNVPPGNIKVTIDYNKK